MAPLLSRMASAALVRRGSDSNGGLSGATIQYGGFFFAGLVIIGMGVSIAILLLRRRVRTRRFKIERETCHGGLRHPKTDSSMNDLSVRKLPYGAQEKAPETEFTRENLTKSIILPERACLRMGTTADANSGNTGSCTSYCEPTPTEIQAFYAARGALPRPFSLGPRSCCSTNNAQTRTPATSSTEKQPDPGLEILKKNNRVSTLSFSASLARIADVFPESQSSVHPPTPSPDPSAPGKRLSTLSTRSEGKGIRASFLGFLAYAFPRQPKDSNNASRRTSQLSARVSVDVPHPPSPPSSAALAPNSSAPSNGCPRGIHTRRVQQLFHPILPDEPRLVLGERVTILHICDDGWCIIARERPDLAPGASAGAELDLELGAVPAGVFVKPLQGLFGERPMRSSSLGVTVEIDSRAAGLGAGGACERSAVTSWSNF